MKIEIPEQKRFVFETRIPIRWADMDALGHVNNAVYFRYMEIARIDWFQSIGVREDTEVQGPVIVNAFCNFYRQFQYPEEVLLKMYVSDARRATFETWAVMESTTEPGVIRAAGGATVVWVSRSQQKSTALPDRLRALIEQSE
ncbi:acyl-CoA thioesterase [Ottowia caeni]|uniref:acyl-CoA thioesterase n=1 Tax=Ottowia caeni TaxID=2870339 RepID=UPI001E5552EA|nr:acyl-CoA thioesterase [Ottowia caeni]